MLRRGPVVGAVGAAVSLRAALAVSAVVLLPALPLPALPLLAGLRRRLAAGSDAPTGPPGPADVDGGRPAVPAPTDAEG